MGLGQTREDLRSRAQAKLDDATTLFRAGSVSNAYYLAGYAVELGLKACVAAQIAAETIPDKAFLKGILNHQFTVLIGLAGLAQALKDEQSNDPAFAANWAVVSEWGPDSRYEDSDSMTTQILIEAIADPKAGILQWIKTHW